MSPRSRLGVVLLFDAVVSAEIDGLRRGLGEPDLGRIVPHLTLVPPTNVRDIDAAAAVVRAAGAASRPLDLVLGPVDTFLPDNPVAYLRVSGDEAGVRALQAGALKGPLHRKLEWPYVPHVTVADGIDPARIAAAVDTLGSYRREVRVDAIQLLEEQDRVWRSIAAFPLGPPAVIGRGGQPLELDTVVEGDAVTITARRDGVTVGRAGAWLRGDHASLSLLEVNEGERRDGVGSHLLAAVQSWAASAGAETLEASPGLDLDEFLLSRGWRDGQARPTRRL